MSIEMKKTVKILELVKVLRSKNAGIAYFGFDLIFNDEEEYELGKKYITKKMIAKLYNMPVEKVVGVIPYDPAIGIKVVIERPYLSGDHFDTDTYGCSQGVPLLSIELPLE